VPAQQALVPSPVPVLVPGLVQEWAFCDKHHAQHGFSITLGERGDVLNAIPGAGGSGLGTGATSLVRGRLNGRTEDGHLMPRP
jgi:hypothetical protein